MPRYPSIETTFKKEDNNLLNDTALITQAKNGDVQAIGALYDQYHALIFRYIWSRIPERQLAEDLTGETFMRMVKNLSAYEIRNVPFSAWLYQIARNLIIDHHRQKRNFMSIPLDDTDKMQSKEHPPDTIVEKQMDIERLREALTKLHENQREVVILRFLVGLPLQEVALTLNRSVASVKSLQHRGLHTLRLLLQQGD